jgi:alpha-beta hydrolase superfamily lysophospholipase
MIERLEGTFWGYQDAELHYQVWKPQTSVGTLLVTHGQAEHSDCYQNFSEDLAKQGWTVFVWDLRGHGRSEGKRGYVNRFQDYCDDLEATIRFVKSQPFSQKLPLVLFAHSMGGLIALRTLSIHSPSGIAALALSAPALGLAVEVPKIKEKAAVLLADWLPKITLFNEVRLDHLVHDANMLREYKADTLRHDKVSPRVYTGMVEGFSAALQHAPEIHLPVIMQLAGQDKVVSTPAAEKVFASLGSKRKELFIYSDSYHEVFNDFDREDAIRDLVQFLGSLKA